VVDGMKPVRDKRYEFPELFVDLFELPVRVLSWSIEGLHFALGEYHFEVGQTFSGSLSFEHWDDAHGLFKANVTAVSKSDGTAEAAFTWVDHSTREVFHRVADETNRGIDVPLPKMGLAMSWSTINWSLTGLLLNHDGKRMDGKQRIVGMIRAEKADDPVVFTAGIIRADPVSRRLALRFVSLPNDTFSMLEKVMKKGRAVRV
jgi:hypothetical protein